MKAAGDTLEREQEHDCLATALDAAAGGEGRTVIIEGPAGIGKTRLVEDVRALAKVRGFGRLLATGDELESAMAWSVVRQMVERSISRYGGDVRERILAGPAGTALATLDRAPTDAPAGDAAVARTLHGLWWVAADLAALRPLLITVDDAQWADLPSLRFLAYLSRRIADLPIALVVAMRPPHERSGPLAELSAGLGPEHIVLAPLSRDAVAALSAGRGSEPAAQVVEAVHTASAGNPFLAGALLDELDVRGLALDDPGTARVVSGLGPNTISRAMLARLPPDATALAAAAAVLGVRGDRWLAVAIVGYQDDRLAAAMDALVAGHVLTEDRGKLVFVHPVVREAVLAQLGPGERAALHATAALTLHASGAPVARVAAHVAYAPKGTLPSAGALLREAAAGLLADGDAVTAAKYLNRAFEDAPQDHRLEAELGIALLRAGQPARAREHLRAAAAEATTSARDRAAWLAAAASATSLVDGPRAAIAELRAELDAWPESGSDHLVLEARLAALCSYIPEENRRSGQRLRRFADLPGHTREERTLLVALAQRERYDVSPASEVAALVCRALGDGAYMEDLADGGDGIVGWVVAVLTLVAADAVGPAAEEVARARVRVRAHGSPLEFGMVSQIAAWIAWVTGDMAAMEAESDAALAAVADEGLGAEVIAVRATATHAAIYAALERGDQDAAAGALRSFDARCAGGPRVIPQTWLREARALLALACDEPVRAYEEAIAFGDEVRAAGLDTPTVPWRPPAVLAAQRLGKEDEARALAAEQLALARRWGAASAVGAALRLVARVDVERRLDALDEAISVLEGSPARLELARALVDRGEALRVARRRTAAHEPLGRGAELAAACGSRVLRKRALDGLAALGDRPRKLMFSGEESLTASERRVAMLATEGRSNRDIAQELFVTPKTVENHLGRVYVKLGISSRRQLAGAIG